MTQDQRSSPGAATPPARLPSAAGEHEARRQLDELLIFQLELEAQNDELRRAHAHVFDFTERMQAKQALQAAESFARATIDAVATHICVLDRGGVVLTTNQAWRAFHAEQARLDVGANYLHLCDNAAPDALESPQLADGIRAVLGRQSDSFSAEYPCRAGGAPRWLGVNVTRFQGDSGNVVIARQDISERKQAETRLRLAASVFSGAREGIMVTDPAGTIVEVNDAFTRITGYSRAEALGRNPRMLKSGRQSAEFYAQMWRALVDQGHWHGEAWNRHKDGAVYAEMITVSAVRDADGATQHYVALFTDVTQSKRQLQQLDRISHFDALTGLPNRALLADRLQQAIAHSERHNQSLAVVYLDLDGFKAVNDQHGHEVGDELLIAVAQRLKSALRDGDTIARIGGDEFVAVLTELAQPDDCEPILARLLQAAAAPLWLEQPAPLELRVGASIGVTLYPHDGADADLLMRHADQAMYHAKQAGKNRYHLFDVGRDVAARSQRAELADIERGLGQDEFVLHYQPKVNMKTGAVIGAEALIRWRHPQRGLLPPAAFLAPIELHPLGVRVGEWVIGEALRQIAAWRRAGLTIAVSVNVGAHQLQSTDFLARLTALLAAQPEVPAHCLELEIVETSALQDMAQVSELMQACRALGVHFALDDFGTGYSSLTYLKRLPVALLKIDQSFVRGMLEDADSLAIIDGVVGLAAAFRRQVIAEGVETVAHGELLLPLGCELAQGYGIARPMPAAELPGWAAAWRPDPAWTAWRGRSARRDDVAVVFAEVEHRHWLRGIEAFLAGAPDAPRPPSAQGCHFSRWHASEGRGRYGMHPRFARLIALHMQLHERGSELVELHSAGGASAEQLAPRLAHLHALRDQMIDGLRRLVHDGAQQHLD
ncbi:MULTISPECIES: EAL domain-containing protein [unclassified Janthinobacterium]|uniref:EAL domain-containing protein n=1 Tax=unclassified Janthinobacterium TaxID=2610881 RepID=UPI000344FEAA|nr:MULTISPECIES: EAL domain-containing protein [unclassified Janthinobacterium]MEC5163970.1 diguanylate cyclase (GGDEF)-like protein/PAS domain S-box-containing protein [Janthinobacterium sp. CG_S6]